MGETTYWITTGPNSTFAVEILSTGSIYGASGFKSVAEAKAWVRLKQQRGEPGEKWVRRPAPTRRK
jgi:hypothetical protein